MSDIDNCINTFSISKILYFKIAEQYSTANKNKDSKQNGMTRKIIYLWINCKSIEFPFPYSNTFFLAFKSKIILIS